MKYSIEVKDERLSVVREYMRGGKIQFFTEDYEKKLVEFEISPDMGEVSVGVLNFSDVSLTGEATADGKIRAVLNPVWDLVQEEISEDKENDGTQMMKLGFNLNRGSYATVVLREFMKSQDLITAGY